MPHRLGPDDGARELTVHQDTTINTSRTSLVLSVSGVVALVVASMIVGRYQERIERLEKDMVQRATVSEVAEVRRAIDEIKAGQSDVRADIRSMRDLLMARMPRGNSLP
jgi:hypothetical protein